MTGTKLYRWSFKIESRQASGSGFVCSGIKDPGGDPTVWYGSRSVKKYYDNGSITTTVEYDLTITDNDSVCEEPTGSNDAIPGKDYGDYHPGSDETTYGGGTITDEDISAYARGKAVAALAGASWSNFVSASGGTWRSAFDMGTSSLVGSGPGYLYSAGLATASAMQLRMYTRDPHIPVRVIFNNLGSDVTFDLTETPTIWTPSWPSAPSVPNPIYLRAYPLPYRP